MNEVSIGTGPDAKPRTIRNHNFEEISLGDSPFIAPTAHIERQGRRRSTMSCRSPSGEAQRLSHARFDSRPECRFLEHQVRAF